MEFWYILAAVLFLLVLLCLARVRVVFSLREDMTVKLRFLFLSFRLYPRKKKVKISSYKWKSFERRKRRAIERRRKKARRAPHQPTAPTGKSKQSLRAQLSFFYDLLCEMYRPFLQHFHIEVARLRIRVGTGDAAKTALLTGAVSQTVAYIAAFLEEQTNLRRTACADISVTPDFLAEKSEADCRVVFSLRVFSLFALGVRFARFFLTRKLTHRNRKQEASHG